MNHGGHQEWRAGELSRKGVGFPPATWNRAPKHWEEHVESGVEDRGPGRAKDRR